MSDKGYWRLFFSVWAIFAVSAIVFAAVTDTWWHGAVIGFLFGVPWYLLCGSLTMEDEA